MHYFSVKFLGFGHPPAVSSLTSRLFSVGPRCSPPRERIRAVTGVLLPSWALPALFLPTLSLILFLLSKAVKWLLPPPTLPSSLLACSRATHFFSTILSESEPGSCLELMMLAPAGAPGALLRLPEWGASYLLLPSPWHASLSW